MEFRILGPLEVREDGRPLDVGGAKQRALLAILLIRANEVVSVDDLGEALWEGSPPPRAHKALQVHVSHLRKALGRDRIATAEPGYVLRVESGELDRERFETLAGASRFDDALELWRGSPLLEFRYHDFAQAEIVRLEELRLVCVEHRIDRELREGRHEYVVGELEALVTDNPLNEGLRGRLMTCLYRCGRQAEALDVYRDGRRLLGEELGLEPSEELRQLEQAILRHDAALDSVRHSPGTGASRGPDRREFHLRSRVRVRRWTIAAVGAVMLAGALTGLALSLLRGGSPALAPVAPDAVALVDTETSRLVGRVPVAGRPSAAAADDRRVWIASEAGQTLTAVSRRALSVERVIGLGTAPDDVAVDGAGAIWVLDEHERLLTRLDSTYGTVTRRFPLPAAVLDARGDRAPGRVRLAAEAGAVWMTDGSTRVLRLDPATGTSTVAVDVGSRLTDIATGPGGVWAISGDPPTVFRISRAGAVIDRIPIVGRAAAAAPYPIAVATGGGVVWILNGNTASVTAIDPETAGVTATIRLGVGSNPAGIAAGEGAAWVANSATGTLARIDAATHEVTSIPIGGSPAGVAVAGNRVWVTVQPSFRLEGGLGIAASAGAEGLPVDLPVLPVSFCSPVFFGSRGAPDFLIASDLPFQSLDALHQTLQMSDAIRFVLAARGFRAGAFSIGYQSCDDSSAGARLWTPATCRRNAQAFARQPNLLGVIGTYNSGCSQVELPILAGGARGPLAMVSSANTYVGLTHAGPGTEPDEPGRYYPHGVRTFARVIAADDVQGAALAILAGRLGLKRVYLLHDGTPHGLGIAESVAKVAAKRGVDVVGREAWSPRERKYDSLARHIARAGADGVFLGGDIDLNGAALVRDLRAQVGPHVRFLASDGFFPVSLLVAEAGEAAEGMLLSFPGVVPSELGKAGQQFAAAFGDAVAGDVSPFSIATAQAADVLLDAIARSDGTRRSVVEELFRTQVEDGILGTFGLDGNGDTTAGAVTIVRVEQGREAVHSVITPPPSAIR